MEQQLSLFNEMPLVSNHPFYDRKLFVRGFDANTRKKIREYVVSHGGEIVDNPSKNIQFVIMDNSVSPKLIDKVTKLTDDGFAVRWIGKPDFDKIVNGDYDAYMMPPKIQKKLNLTIERINKWKFRIEDKRNPFSLHEIFIGGKLTGNIDDISQMFGNLGSYANRELFPETDNIPQYYAMTSVFVLPTAYREGTPRVILEAMASARAIITTNTPGCKETVVEGENGYFVPTHNPEVLAEKMMIFINNLKRIEACGQKSFVICKNKYEVSIINSRMLEIMGI